MPAFHQQSSHQVAVGREQSPMYRSVQSPLPSMVAVEGAFASWPTSQSHMAQQQSASQIQRQHSRGQALSPCLVIPPSPSAQMSTRLQSPSTPHRGQKTHTSTGESSPQGQHRPRLQMSSPKQRASLHHNSPPQFQAVARPPSFRKSFPFDRNHGPRSDSPAMNRACSPVRQATVSPLAWGGPHAVGVVPFAVPVSWMVGSEPDRDDDSTSYATEESEEPWFSLPPCSKSKSKSSCCL